MYGEDFRNYISEKTCVSFQIVDELFSQHYNLFEAAQILIEQYGVDKEMLGRAWGDYLGFAYVDPNKSIVNQDYIKKIGISFIEMNKILPLYKLGKAVTFCTPNPTNPSIVEHTQKKLGELVSLVFCFPFDIKTYLINNHLK